jgi:hypothetical protein
LSSLARRVSWFDHFSCARKQELFWLRYRLIRSLIAAAAEPDVLIGHIEEGPSSGDQEHDAKRQLAAGERLDELKKGSAG